MYDYNFKVILIGDRGTGKNTLARRFLTNLKSDTKEPIGVDFEQKLTGKMLNFKSGIPKKKNDSDALFLHILEELKELFLYIIIYLYE